MKNKIIAFSILTFAVLVSGLFLSGIISLDYVGAQSIGNGVAIVNINVDSVSGSSASFSGSIDAGFVGCGGGSGGGQSDVCFCCSPNDPQLINGGDWETCDISSASYVIKNSSGTIVKSGSVPLGSAVNTPAGCLTTCTTDSNRCDQTRSYNFAASGLSAGTYTVDVTGNDCLGNNTSSETFVINSPLSGSCSASPDPADLEETVTWVANASGGTGSYSYSWSGAVTGNGSSRTATYSTTGTKSATVTITSGGQSIQRTCSVEVEDQGGGLPDLVCSQEFSAVRKGQSQTFQASEGTLTGYTWSSSVGASVSPTSGQSTTGTFNQSKYSTVTVQDSSGATKRCHVDVVDIRANGSDGPITITSGDSVTLSWNSGSQTNFCTAGGAWSGSKTTSGGGNTSYASQTLSNITSSGTYSITCGRSPAPSGYSAATDSVVINVEDEETPQPPPGSGTITVSSNLSTSWTISGPQEYSGSGTSGSYTGAPTGTYTITPQPLAGYSFTVTPSSSQTLSNGQTIGFSINYWNSSVAVCTPTSQTVQIGQAATLATNPGGQTGSWFSSGASPQNATSHQYFPSYSTTGAKTVFYTRLNNTSECTVNVVNPSYTLSVNSSGASGVSITSSTGHSGITNYTAGSVQSGTSVILTAPATSGSANFSSWSGCTSVSGIGNRTCNLTMPSSNKTVTANYTSTTGTINVTSNLNTSWTITGGAGYSGSGTSAQYTNATANPTVYTITNVPDISGYTKTITPATSQTLSGGSSITFTINYSDSGGSLACSPSSQGIVTGGTANFTASGGSGTFSWSAPGGSPSSGGNSSSFASSYSSNGLKTVTANRGSDSDQCFVSVSSSGNDLPVGSLTTDNATCRASGWAADPDNRGEAVQVQLYANGVLKQNLTANSSGAPLTSCPEGNCAYSYVFTDLNPGQAYSIEARAVDNQTGALQTIGTANLTCSASADFFLTKTNDIKIDTADGTGTSNASTIKVTPVNGFSSNVSLSALADSADLNAKATYIFGDPTLSSGEFSTGSSFQVQLDSPVPSGIYPITVTGTGGGLNRSVIVNLLINAKSPQFIEF